MLKKLRELAIIPSQLPFLRKLAAFKLIARQCAFKAATSLMSYEDLSFIQSDDTQFAKALGEQFDDAEEHTLLC